MPLYFKESCFDAIHNETKCIIISEDLKTCCIASFLKYDKERTYMSAEFINVISINHKDIQQGKIIVDNKSKGTIKTYIYSYCKYYVLSSRKKIIQELMEMRAVNKILQKLTGDESFTY